jgi:hypothetical protein
MKAAILVIAMFMVSCAGAHASDKKLPTLHSEICDVGTMNFLKVPKGSVNFSVSRKRPTSSDIYINSNFFDRRGPIGELVISRKRVSSRVRGGGYFFVRGGNPGVSAYVPPKNPDHSTQSILVAINDGKPNSTLFRRAHAREATYRSLVGTDAAGALHIIVSGRGCNVTIADIVSIGRSKGIKEAILPDAGSSVDYRLSDGSSSVSMKAVPGLVKSVIKIEEPKSYIVGKIR